MSGEDKNTPPFGDLVDAVDRQTAAIKYLADCIGMAADSLNPIGADGIAKVKLKIEQIGEEEQEVLTLGDIRKRLNEYGKEHGREAVFTVLKNFADTLDPVDVAQKDYPKLMEALNG